MGFFREGPPVDFIIKVQQEYGFNTFVVFPIKVKDFF